jgi:hypothetical protein
MRRLELLECRDSQIHNARENVKVVSGTAVEDDLGGAMPCNADARSAGKSDGRAYLSCIA